MTKRPKQIMTDQKFHSTFRFIKVAADGHLRLYCCGKPVTGIGNVPKWDPPIRDKSHLVKPNAAADEEDDDDGEEENGEAVQT
jgi:hypothetical protein